MSKKSVILFLISRFSESERKKFKLMLLNLDNVSINTLTHFYPFPSSRYHCG